LDFEAICCDPREAYHLTWGVSGTTFSGATPIDPGLQPVLQPVLKPPVTTRPHGPVDRSC
jgi:hypothetical protein